MNETWTWKQGLPILGAGVALIVICLVIPMMVTSIYKWRLRHRTDIPIPQFEYAISRTTIPLLWNMWLDRLTNKHQADILYVNILSALQTFDANGILEGSDVGRYPLWVTHWDRPLGHEVRKDIDWRDWVVRIRALRSILEARGLDTEGWGELTSVFEQRLAEQLPDRIAEKVTKLYLESITHDTIQDEVSKYQAQPPTFWARLLRDDDA